MRNKILVLGCGRLGSSIASFASSKGRNVIVIDNRESSFERLDETFSGFQVVGDAGDTSVLENEGAIKTAQEVVIATGMDNLNLFLAHVCSVVYEVPKIIVRFDDPDLEKLIKGLKNVKAIYPFQLSFEEFIDLEKEKKK